MATLRVLQRGSMGDWSMSRGLRSYILCCFASSSRSLSDSTKQTATESNGKGTMDEYDVVDSGEGEKPRANGHAMHEGIVHEYVQLTLTDADQPQSNGSVTVAESLTHIYVEERQRRESSSDEEARVDQSRNDARDVGTEGDALLAAATGRVRGSQMSLETTLNDDPRLFNLNDLQAKGDERPPQVARFGSVLAVVGYDYDKNCLTITVVRVSEVPAKERGGSDSSRVHVVLLAGTKKLREKTKIRSGANPEYNETFSFKIAQDAVPTSMVRLRLYGCERMKRERLISEALLRGGDIDLVTGSTNWHSLKPRSELTMEERETGDDSGSLTKSDSGGSASSVNSLQGGAPEILLGLAYNSATGQLQMEVIRGSNFRTVGTGRAPDTYVKVQLLSFNGQEITRTKTSMRRGQPNPVFKESFIFKVASFQLGDVTLMVSVFNKRSMKRKEMMGWCSLGHSNSGEEEASHWNEMKNNRRQHVNRWHTLVDS